MTNRAILTATILLALSAAPARALGPGDAGTSGAQFLKLAPGARPAAMGEAFSGVADDVHAVYYNPADLARTSQVEIAAAHQSYFQGISHEFAAVSVPMLSWIDTQEPKESKGVLAFSLSSLSVNDIERRGTTETDAPSDTFGSRDFAYGLSYAYAPG